MLSLLDPVLHWLAVVAYAAGAIMFIYGLTFSKEKWLNTGVITAIIGAGLHTGALGARWIATGHGPFLKRYELFSSYVLIAMYMFLWLQHKRPNLRPVGVLIMPVSLLIMGLALTTSPADKEVPATFNYIWIVLHIIFAQVSYGAGLIGSGLALLYLLKKRAQNRGIVNGIYERLPHLEDMDNLSYRFHGFAFLTIGVMIASGAIWANYAWGRYWSWDPIESWSLISWFLYGIYLHLRRIHGWVGTKAAWFSFVALVALIFILIGIGWAYDSIHSPYFE